MSRLILRHGLSLALWATGWTLVVVSSSRAQEPAASGGKTVRLLTVGNSFSQNATHVLDGIVKADGQTLIHHRCVIGGSGFAQHWERAEKHTKDPADKAGRYESGKSLLEELKAEPWDVITIQQASIRSHNVETYRPSAKQLCDFIRQHAPQSEVVLLQTWAYRVDDGRFSAKAAAAAKPGEPKTREEMYAGLSAAYRTVGQELGVRRIPVGDAFHLADSDAAWGFKPDLKFDFAGAEPKKLPDQTHSLHIGWAWSKTKEGKPVMVMDGHHANAWGGYLGACVFYEFLFDRSVVGNKFVPPYLPKEDVRYLQETAHRAVEGAKEENAKVKAKVEEKK